MNELEHIEMSKKFAVDCIQGSRMVCKGPAIICCIVISPEDATLVYECKIYDGEDASGKLKFDIEGQFLPFDVTSTHSFYFRRGIYVDFTTNIGNVTIHYDPLRD